MLEKMHDQSQEQVSGFAGLVHGQEVLLDTVFFHAAEGWVGEDDVHPVSRTVILVRAGEGIVVTDVGAVKDLIGDAGNGVIAKNCEKYEEALIQALSIKWDRQVIAERMKNMSWRGCAQQVTQIYHDVKVSVEPFFDYKKVIL